MRERNRGISTVFDVAFGLLLISASVVLITTQLDSSTDTSLNTTEADQTADSLSTITMEVTYTVQFRAGNQSVNYTLTDTGTAAYHLKRAALLNVTINERKFVETNYPQQVNRSIRERFRGSKTKYHIVAQWQPYQKPQARLDDETPNRPVMYGRSSAGIQPPPREDVSSAKITVESGMDSAATVRSRDIGGGMPKSIAVTVIRGHFPISETQFALERGGTSEGYTRSKYKRMAGLLGTQNSTYIRLFSRQIENNESTRTNYNPRAYYLNGLLNEMLMKQIREDTTSVDKEYLRRHITTGQVEITVRTWE